MRRAPRLAAGISAAVLAGLALGACGDGGGELTIYSGRTENLVGPLLDRFADETGIDVAVLYGDSADLAVQIDEEGDRSPADVFLSQSPGAMGYLDGAGRLRPLDRAILRRVPERFRADDGDWVGLSGRVRVLVYNTDVLDEADLPASVFDLTDPRWRGRLGVAPTNGSFQDFVTGMRELEGDDRTLDWLRAVVDNDVRTYENNLAIVDAVGRGEIDVGLVNHYYNEQVKAENPDSPTANHLLGADDPGRLILTTAVGVLDGADRAGDAERLVEFLLSRDAQEFFAGETFEYPLAAGVDPVVRDLPPLESIPAPRLDLSNLGGGLQRTRELIRESGLERA